ncbi:DMT family transporter [Burkholderia ubonensis]|uniref:DMT family transporter n=1 Tax=Burkholderia ubonensis TaxID=101571 RepID=UPI0007580981|nr:DMT family transporter [Burkholderia ubonensis]KUZ91182.1 transporter [Burkholderia ubonensis]KVA22883.1 transporter [Burkholderia ubonensis]KVA27668.1 transporter [Burkholderia ubonensis]KVA44282.1 transporter [Burkholderia ubonensis]
MNDANTTSSSATVYGKGIVACVIATILMGAMFPVMTDALVHIDPFTFTSLRYLVAGAGFVVLLRITEGRDAFRSAGESVPLAWLLGSVGFCGFGSFVFLGQQLAGEEGALTASIMMATQPMMGLLLNALVRRVAPAPLSVLFVVLSFAGVSLVITRGDLIAALHAPQHYAANALIILGALCWVVYTFGAARFTRWSALKYTTVTTWLGLTTIIAVNLVLIATHRIAAPSLAAVHAILPHLAYMGPVAGFGAILLWMTGNRILGPMNGVLFMDIVPITAFVVSAFTGVVPNRAQVAGAGLTGAALILNNLYLRRRAQRIGKALARASSASA